MRRKLTKTDKSYVHACRTEVREMIRRTADAAAHTSADIAVEVQKADET